MKRFSGLVVILFFIFSMISCAGVPKKEIGDAKAALDQAASVEANLNATNDYYKAESLFTNAVALTNKNKNDDAKKSAVNSLTNSRTAYEKAVDWMYNKAVSKFAAFIVKDQFVAAQKDYEDFKVMKKSTNFTEEFKKGSELYGKFKNDH